MTGSAAGGAPAPPSAALRVSDLGPPREDEVGTAGTKRAAEALRKARPFVPPPASGVDAEAAGAVQERVVREADQAVALAAKSEAKLEEAAATPSLSVLRDEADGHAKAAARALVRAIEARFEVATRCAAAFDGGGATGAGSASHRAALRARMATVERHLRRLRVVSGMYPRIGSDATLGGGREGGQSSGALPGRPTAIDVDAMLLLPATVRDPAEVEAEPDVQRALREVAEARGADGPRGEDEETGSVGEAAAAAALGAEAGLAQLYRARHEEEGDAATDTTRRAMFDAVAAAGTALRDLAARLADGGGDAGTVEAFPPPLDAVLVTQGCKAEGGPAAYGAAAAEPVAEAAKACEEACESDPSALLAAGRATRRALDAGLGEAARTVERPVERLAEARRALERIQQQQQQQQGDGRRGGDQQLAAAARSARRTAAGAVDSAEKAVRAAARAVRVATRVNKARLERLERRARDGGALGEAPCAVEEAQLVEAADAAARVALHAPEAEAAPRVEATVVEANVSGGGGGPLAHAAAGGATSLHLRLLPVGAEAPRDAVPCVLPLRAGAGDDGDPPSLSPTPDAAAAASLPLHRLASGSGDLRVLLTDPGSGEAVLQGAVAMRDVSDATPPRAGVNAAHRVQVALTSPGSGGSSGGGGSGDGENSAGAAGEEAACTVQLEVVVTLPRGSEARCITAAGAALASLPALCERARAAAARGMRAHFAARADSLRRKWAAVRMRDANALESARARRPPLSSLLSRAARLRRLRRRVLLQARDLWVVPCEAKLQALHQVAEAAEGVEQVRRQRHALEERRAEAKAGARRVAEAEAAVEEARRGGSAALEARLKREADAARRERDAARGAVSDLQRRRDAAAGEEAAWAEKSSVLRQRVGRELKRLRKRARFLRKQELRTQFQHSPVAAMLAEGGGGDGGGGEDAPAPTADDLRAAHDEASDALRVGKAKELASIAGTRSRAPWDEEQSAVERMRSAVSQGGVARALPALPVQRPPPHAAPAGDDSGGKGYGLWDATFGWVVPSSLVWGAPSREQ